MGQSKLSAQWMIRSGWWKCDGMRNRVAGQGLLPIQRDDIAPWLVLLIGFGSAAAILSAAPAGAQAPAPRDNSGIEEIVVRGEESDSSRDFDAGDSVTGFGAEDLAALGAQDIADLAAFTPNLEIVTSGATTPTFFIRGVGLNDFNSNSTGAVAIYQDDVARNAPALQLSSLFDIEAVNVLRGPQGTGLARNASAGAIKIYTRKPSGQYGGYLSADVGNFDARDLQGAVEAPIFEDIVAGRFAFRISKRDGTMKNRCGNAPAFGDRTPIATAQQQVNLGLRDTDPPWSLCGEPVDRFGDPDGDGIDGPFVSIVPPGLASRVNDVDNWAVRGTLLFQPTLDMSWLLNGHGARRDELSRLGQSIGTQGFFCANGDIGNCFLGQDPPARVEGLLGGAQGAVREGYVPPEIRKRLLELAPCNEGTPGFPGGSCLKAENRAANNAAKTKLAKELARDLDSKPWEGDFNHTGPTKNDTYGVFLKGDIALPSLGMQLTTVTGYDAYDRLIDIDLDFSPETLFHIETDDEGWQVYQDVRLEGHLGERIEWEIGGWFLRERLDVLVQNDFGKLGAFGVGLRDYRQDVWSTAAYVSLSFDFWQNFTLDGGARYNAERKKLNYQLERTGPDPLVEKLDDVWDAPTGTVRLTYRFRENTHVFWKYTRGWKPGTYNATSSAKQGVSIAKPEQIDSYETGVHASWFEGRVGLDFSFFYYSYRDYQIFTAQQFAGGNPEFVIINASKVEMYGAEIDAKLRPWDGAFANFRLGWIESQFLDFVQIQQVNETVSNGKGGFQQSIVNRELQNTGNNVLNTPQFKISISAEQMLPLGRWGSVTARYDGTWTTETFFDATDGRGLPNDQDLTPLPKHTTSQIAYWLHNLRLTYRPPVGQLEISGWIRNIENQSYKTFAFDATTFNNTSIYFVGDPRTYGGSVNINF